MDGLGWKDLDMVDVRGRWECGGCKREMGVRWVVAVVREEAVLRAGTLSCQVMSGGSRGETYLQPKRLSMDSSISPTG